MPRFQEDADKLAMLVPLLFPFKLAIKQEADVQLTVFLLNKRHLKILKESAEFVPELL